VALALASLGVGAAAAVIAGDGDVLGSRSACSANPRPRAPTHAGNSAGQPDFVILNLDKLEGRFAAGEEVTLEALKQKGYVRASGRRRNLPLKVLGDGELKTGLTIKAGAFSKSAKAKIEAAGGTAEVVEGRNKWTKKAYKKRVVAMGGPEKAAAEKKAKRVAALKAKVGRCVVGCLRARTHTLECVQTCVHDWLTGRRQACTSPTWYHAG